LISTLAYLRKLISKGEIISKRIKVEAAIEQGQFRGLTRHIIDDKSELVARHMVNIEKLPQVTKLSNFLEGLVKDKGSGIKVRKIVSDYLNTFLYTYAESIAFPKFNQTAFYGSYSRLEDYLYGELQYHSFVPLYSFKMQASKIMLDNDFVIRKIKPQEFVALSEKIGNEAVFLKYAVEFQSTIFEYNKKRDEINRVITSLRLFKQGAVSYNEIFTKPAPDIALGESVISNSRSMQRVPEYNLDHKEGRRFKRFYNYFTKTIGEIRRVIYLDIAIDRFNSALEQKESADKIIDLSVALEALFSSTSEDLTYKLSIRVSVLLGVDYDTNYLFDFVRVAYKIRSLLVHGKVNKNAVKVFEIGSKKFGLYDVAKELEEITRLSIRRILSLVKHYNYRKQEDLIKVIDKVAIGGRRKILRS
jgi:hypothetical protein